MLKWRQRQLIADKLLGKDPGIVRTGDLDEPWATIYHRVRPVSDPDAAYIALWRATEGLDDRLDLVMRILPSVPGQGVPCQFRPLAEMAADLPPVDWLWPSWIPRGMLSLLGAAPGAGKSLLALDLARRVIHGPTFPDGAPVPRPGSNVIYVDAEAVPQIQNQRARAWGIDRDHLYAFMPPDTYGMLDFGDQDHQDTLTQMAYELQPELIVIDSLSSVTARGENKIEDVRALIGFLSAVAREFDLGLLLIHHLRKRPSDRPLGRGALSLDDFRGSGHIAAVARSVMALSIVPDSPQPDRNGPRRLEVIKTNLCRYPPPLGIAFEPGDAAGLGVPQLRYIDAPAPYRQPTQVDACSAWLVRLLGDAGRPLKAAEIIEQAVNAGFTHSSVYRARKQLGGRILDTDKKRSPHNHWTLAPADEATLSHSHSFTLSNTPRPPLTPIRATVKE